MKPGRELDALIAEKVMGLTKMHPSKAREIAPQSAENYKPSGNYEPMYVKQDSFGQKFWLGILPAYSTEIAAAWEVVDKLTSRESIDVEISPSKFHNEYEVSIKFENEDGDEYGPFHFLSDSAPHAICLAALKAVGVV